MANGSRKRSSWTDEELAKLRDLWGTLKDSDVAAALGKSVSCIRIRATILNLREPALRVAK